MTWYDFTWIYEHTCNCEFNGDRVNVMPHVDGSVFYVTTPKCVETGVELKWIDAIRHSSKSPQDHS